MKPQPRYKPGDRIGGRYQVHKALMGGMGEVYLCLDLEQMIPLALKTFQQRYLIDMQRLRNAFEQEVATWVALEVHPNVVRCFWMQILDNQPFMALEWIASEEGQGTDLRGWLRHGALDLKLALEIAIDICNGLIHAQAKQPGLVHRDLKPENILIAQGGLAKITDFGLAQIVEAAGLVVSSERVITNNHQNLIGGQGIVGTPAYMAPEQWRNELLDERTDIYALGCILYEMLTGRQLFPMRFISDTPQSRQAWLSRMRQAHETTPLPKLPVNFTLALNDLLEKCLTKNPQHRLADLNSLLTWLMSIYQQQFDQLRPVQPTSDTFTAIDYNNRGNTYADLRKYEAALADYNCAIRIDPNYAQAYANRGNVYTELQAYEAALLDFEHALELDPNETTAHLSRASTYYALQDYNSSISEYSRAIELNPKLTKAFVNRAGIYADLHEYEAAFADYSRAIEIDPNLLFVYNNRGITYHTLQQYEAALLDYNHALELDPYFSQAYYNRGVTYHALQDYERALVDYDRAIELDSRMGQAYICRGDIYQALKQFEVARDNYSYALDIDPTNAKAYHNRGFTSYRLQDYDEALSDYGRAIELDPDLAEAYLGIGGLWGNQGRLEDALPYFEKAEQLGLPKGAQYAAEVRQRLGMGKIDPIAQALINFRKTGSLESMEQVVNRHPILIQPDVIALIEWILLEENRLEVRRDIEQRLDWLQQIANI